jgi:hypothetical protein
MRNKIIYLMILSGLVLTVSCKKKLDDAYTNPNFPTRVPVETILPTMIANMHRGITFDSRFVNRYIQNLCVTTVSDDWERHGYAPGSDNGGEIWRIHYWNFGINTIDMINWAREEGKYDYVGAGYASFAWSWLMLTEYHGDVILKDAFKRNNLTFKYDPQEDVYAYVKVLCDSAEYYFNRTDGNSDPANFLKGDKYFLGGNKSKWLKFVNGIRARLYNDLTNKADYKPDSVVYYCNKAMQSADDDAMISFEALGTSNTSNFYGPLRANFGAYRQSAYIVDLMNGANPVFNGVTDPRRNVMLRPTSTGAYTGIVSTAGQTSIAPTTTTPNVWGAWNSTTPSQDTGRYLFRNAALWPVMTYSEIQFIKSEALFRKGDKAGALAAYREAIKGHFDMIIKYFNYSNNNAYTMTAATRDAFLANTSVVPTDPNTLTLSQIMLQKYISLWVWGSQQTWTDMRRYHYTDADPATGESVYRNFNLPSSYYPANNNKPVYRVRPRYNSEYIWNLSEISAIGGNASDYHTVECWFSKP